MKEYIEKALTISSVFFDSIFNNENIEQTSMGKVLKVFLNIIYAALISIPFGFILQIAIIIGIYTLTNFEVAREINIFIIPLFLFICLSVIIILNYEDMSFSLPKSVLNSYIILQLIRPLKGIWKPIVFISIITFTMMVILLWFFSSLTIPEKYFKETVFSIFVISLLLSMILYSESTKEEINRKKRQFVFYILTFLVFISLNIYQMAIYISTEPNNQTIMFFAITILGLVLSMATAIDKTRCIFKLVDNKDIKNKWDTFEEKYSYKVGIKIVNDRKNELNQTLEIVKEKWRTGDWKKRIIIICFISTVILIESLLIICFFNQRQIKEFVYSLLINVKELVLVGLFHGDEHKVSLLFFVIINIAIIIWLINDVKLNLKQSNYIYKIKVLCRIEFILLILLASIVL